MPNQMINYTVLVAGLVYFQQYQSYQSGHNCSVFLWEGGIHKNALKRKRNWHSRTITLCRFKCMHLTL